MKKFLEGLGIFIFGLGIFIFGSGFIICTIMIFTEAPELQPAFIAMDAIMGLFLFLLLLLFLFLRKKKLRKRKQQGFSTTTRRDIPELGVTVKTTVTPDIPPKEILRDMRKSYTLLQAQNDLRILNDCISLIQTTTSFQTFFMRSELGKQKALTLWQAEQAKIKGIRGTQEAVTTMFSLAESQKERILKASFEQIKQKVSSLSTPRGKKNNWYKYWEQLQKYQDEFDLDCLDLYAEIVRYTEQELEVLER